METIRSFIRVQRTLESPAKNSNFSWRVTDLPKSDASAYDSSNSAGLVSLVLLVSLVSLVLLVSPVSLGSVLAVTCPTWRSLL